MAAAQNYFINYPSYEEEESDSVPSENEVSSELNHLGLIKPTLKVKDMVQDTHYRILGARKVSTKFGNRVVLDLENYQLFLPARYEKLSDKAVADLNENKYCIVNKGAVSSTFSLEFINVNED